MVILVSSLLKAAQFFILISVLNLPASRISALRTGAPSLACINLRPFHGLHRSRPGSSSQFFLIQSSLTYAPNQNISVEILTNSNERYFRGFMVQAYDPSTGSQIGRFLPTSESKPVDCSAATHRNNLNKHHATLIWVPSATFPASLNPLSDERSSDALTLADQWLGTRTSNLRNQASSTSGTAPTAASSSSGTQQKRQLSPGSSSTASHHSRRPANSGTYTHQVRYRATIVVTYDEFYNGFESSEQKLEKLESVGGIGVPSSSNLTTIISYD